MKTILFQGDSITDAGRIRENPDDLGQGYSNFAAGRLGLQQPGAYKFLNRGFGGNRTGKIPRTHLIGDFSLYRSP